MITALFYENIYNKDAIIIIDSNWRDYNHKSDYIKEPFLVTVIILLTGILFLTPASGKLY